MAVRHKPRKREARPNGLLELELQALALRAVRGEHQHHNLTLFGGQLRTPRFAVSVATSRLGCWEGGTKTLELSEQLLVGHSWGQVVEVLKHEMAHQFVEEVLGVSGQTAHGPAFRLVCAERGIDAQAGGLPAARSSHSLPPNAMLEKIGGLLSLAASSNENEAHAAMNAAQKLMLRHNLQEVNASACADARRSLRFAQLGRATGRVFEFARVLAMILDEHFFVQGIWVPVWRVAEGKRGHILEICGTRANVDIAEYAHDFLIQTAASLWTEHKRRHSIRANRDRLVFTAGVMNGFLEKLNGERKRNVAAGLVWLGDPAVAQYFKQRHPRARYTQSQSSQHTAAHAAGRVAGGKIVLHKGVHAATSTRGKLLPSG